jgi:hypothetical protein
MTVPDLSAPSLWSGDSTNGPSALGELRPFLLGGCYRVLANWATRLFKTVASKTQFNGVGRLRTYISLTHLAL